MMGNCILTVRLNITTSLSCILSERPVCFYKPNHVLSSEEATKPEPVVRLIYTASVSEALQFVVFAQHRSIYTFAAAPHASANALILHSGVRKGIRFPVCLFYLSGICTTTSACLLRPASLRVRRHTHARSWLSWICWTFIYYFLHIFVRQSAWIFKLCLTCFLPLPSILHLATNTEVLFVHPACLWSCLKTFV